MNGGEIYNCINFATVRCIKNEEVYNASIVGGIVGRVSVGGKVSYCVNNGNIYGIGLDTGGIAGYAEGLVNRCYNTGNIEGRIFTGGIVGGQTGGIIQESFNRGSVKGNGGVGGISGTTYGLSQIINCYNLGNIEGTTNVGGICGILSNGNESGQGGKVSNCYSIQTITGTLKGGVIGRNEPKGSIINSFHNQPSLEACGSNEGDIDSVTGIKTDTEMKEDSFVELLNTGNDEEVWIKDSTNINNGYPILKWQLEKISEN